MQIELSEEERAGVDAALARERRVRHWRRYQAIRLLAEGVAPRMVASTLGVSVASIYNWAKAWQGRKHDGMKEGARPGRKRRLDAQAERLLAKWLAGGPRAFGHETDLWTVPLLCRHLARLGYECSDHTLRRALHRMGWRWRGSGYVLAGGRVRPAAERADCQGTARVPLHEPPATDLPAARMPDPPAKAYRFDLATH